MGLDVVCSFGLAKTDVGTCMAVAEPLVVFIVGGRRRLVKLYKWLESHDFGVLRVDWHSCLDCF